MPDTCYLEHLILRSYSGSYEMLNMSKEMFKKIWPADFDFPKVCSYTIADCEIWNVNPEILTNCIWVPAGVRIWYTITLSKLHHISFPSSNSCSYKFQIGFTSILFFLPGRISIFNLCLPSLWQFCRWEWVIRQNQFDITRSKISSTPQFVESWYVENINKSKKAMLPKISGCSKNK